MTELIEAPDLASAWVRTLRTVQDLGGLGVNVVTSVAAPEATEHAQLRAVLDARLRGHLGRNPKTYSVGTVASTIFPSALYRAPSGSWTPENGDAFDAAASRLYTRYRRNYPLIQKAAPANSRGTYFGRLVAWERPNNVSLNQLDLRIRHLREMRRRGYGQWNLNELVLSSAPEAQADDLGQLQLYRPSDHPGTLSRGFPCLVHVDVSVFQSRLHLTAVYRHQLLITKGYGNLLGLSRLQRFMAQQTGYDIGELCMVGGFSDAEYKGTWGKTESVALLQEAEEAIA